MSLPSEIVSAVDERDVKALTRLLILRRLSIEQIKELIELLDGLEEFSELKGWLIELLEELLKELEREQNSPQPPPPTPTPKRPGFK